MSEWPAPEFESKICPLEKLAERLAALPRPLVFTNGCFDILHRGHVTYLAQARSAGAALVLALNTDASVRRQGKGDDRPINPLENRAAVAAALESVDLVTWFDDDTPAALIEMVKPDVLIKGGDGLWIRLSVRPRRLRVAAKYFRFRFYTRLRPPKLWRKSVKPEEANDGFEQPPLGLARRAFRRPAATRFSAGACGRDEAATIKRILAADAGPYPRFAAPA